MSVLLRRQRRTQGEGQRLLRRWRRQRRDRKVIKDLKSTIACKFVALDNLRRVQTQRNEHFSLAQKFAREDHDKVGAIAHFRFLLLRRIHKELRGGVHDFHFSNDRGGIARHKNTTEVIDNHFVASVGAIRSAHNVRQLIHGLDIP